MYHFHSVNPSMIVNFKTFRDTCSLAQGCTVSKLQQQHCDLKPALRGFQSSHSVHLVQILPISIIILTFLVEIGGSECVSPSPNLCILCAHLCLIIIWRPLSWWGHSGLVLQTLRPSHLTQPPWPSHFSFPGSEGHTPAHPRQLEPYVFLIKQPTGPHRPCPHLHKQPIMTGALLAVSTHPPAPTPPRLLKL